LRSFELVVAQVIVFWITDYCSAFTSTTLVSQPLPSCTST